MMRWLLLLIVAGCGSPVQGPQDVTVFAAASLTDVLEELAATYEARHPNSTVVLNVGATSLLARQIEAGAPADVFLSANMAWMDRLVARGRIHGSPVTLAGNRLAVAGAPDAALLSDPELILYFNSIALADPSHVPAGQYAQEALECAGLWQAVAPRVIPMLDVRMALLSVTTGAAEAALVYASDLRATAEARVLMEWPQDCAPDIRYAAGRIAGAPNPAGAAAFLAFVTGEEHRFAWERHGFAAPGPR